MRHEDFSGKWWLWSNGLRFKITGECDKYGDWIAEKASGFQWTVRPESMRDAIELTEEEAKSQYFDIRERVIKVVACGTCCGWKCGKPEFSVKMKLKQGKVPRDETDRLQDQLCTFFRANKVESVVPYVYRTDEGVELSFISTIPSEEYAVFDETLTCEHCNKETKHLTRKFKGERWFQKCTECEWHMFKKTGVYEAPVGDVPVGWLEREEDQ